MSRLVELIGKGAFLKHYSDKRGEYSSRATTDAGKLKVWRADNLVAKIKYTNQAKSGRLGAKGALGGINHDLKQYRDARNSARNQKKQGFFSRMFSRKKKPEEQTADDHVRSSYNEKRRQKPDYTTDSNAKNARKKPLITPGRAAVGAIGYGLYRYHSRLK